MNPEKIFKSRDVFCVSRDLPLNYVKRANVDDRLISNLARDKHIVIFASSKQGKTCLRKQCFKDADYILVQCSNKWDLSELHAAILKQAGYELVQSEKKTVGGKAKVIAKLAGFIPIQIGVEAEGKLDKEVTKEPLELDIGDANDVVLALKSIDFKRYIILEDFHYLKRETQIDFAIALKAYHEISKLSFVIIGVWLEENRLIYLNGDLTGRISSINADVWPPDELLKVIKAGEELLNITIDDRARTSIVKESYGNIYILQEACYRLCEESRVDQTQDRNITIGTNTDVTAIVRNIVNEQSGRYKSFISHFAEGFRNTEFQMYRWILHTVITADIRHLEKGFGHVEIIRSISKDHPKKVSLNTGNISQALQYCATLQVAKGIMPIILDYDTSNQILSIVDKGFVVWLQNQDKKQLLSQLTSEPP